jgi:acyl-CoA synthetase (AMP-forming)/AMP-acid ligase II
MAFDLLESGDPTFVALHHGERIVTRGELRTASRRAAAFLRKLGLGRGDIVAMWLPDGAVWMQLFFAAAQLGIVMVPVSARLKSPEALRTVKGAKARVLIVPQKFADFDYVGAAREIKASSIALQHIVEVAQFDSFEWNTFKPYARREGRGTDLLCTFDRCETDGAPKLAVHTSEGIARHARHAGRFHDIREKDVVLCAPPLSSVHGFVHAMAALASGAACMLMPEFKAGTAAAAIERHRVTHFFGSDTMMDDVLDAGDYALASWRGGAFSECAGMGRRVVTQARESWGTRLVALYGTSECLTIPALCNDEGSVFQRGAHDVAPHCAEIAFRIVDPVSGAPLPDGQQGELQLRGYSVMAGYLHHPKATSQVFTTGGWFKTGSLATAEGGAFRCVAAAQEDKPRSRDPLDCLEI